jgi:hypothetical protein
MPAQRRHSAGLDGAAAHPWLSRLVQVGRCPHSSEALKIAPLQAVGLKLVSEFTRR